MATREGGVGGGGGGRKGNPSPTPQAKYKPPIKPSTSLPKPPLTSSSNKPLPNYLKPTISSSLDPSSSTTSRTARRATNPAKPAPVPHRRSFEKPPSPANPPKAFRGPTITGIAINTNTRDVVKTVSRNTLPPSTAAKSALPPPKPVPQKSFSSLSSRATKAALAAPVVKRSLSAKAAPTTNHGANVRRVVKKTSPRSIDKDPFDHMIGQSEDEDDHEVQSLHDISEMPDHDDQLGDPVMADQENEAEKQPAEEAAVTEEESAEPADHDDHEEEAASEGASEEDSTNVEEKHVVVVLDGEGSKEGEETKAAPAAEDEVAEPESPTTAKAYNDVIEETASKLMERKNKVRALAGAFETVISLDSQ